MKSNRFLIGAEYTSLGLSALGTILATVTGQVGLAATPLTLALSLNLINRKELAKSSQQINNDLVGLEESLNYLKNTIQEQIQSIEATLTTKASTEKIKQDHQQQINVIRQNIEQIQANLTRVNQSNQGNELATAIAPLQEKLNTLEKQFDALNQAQIELAETTPQLNNDLVGLEESLNYLRNTIQEQIQSIETTLIIKASTEKIKLENREDLKNAPRLDEPENLSQGQQQPINSSFNNLFPSNEIERGIYEINKGIEKTKNEVEAKSLGGAQEFKPKSVKNYESIVRHHARDKYVVFHSLQTVEGIYNQLEVVGSCVDLRNVVVLDRANLIGSTISGTIVTPSQGVSVREIGLNINVAKKILPWEKIAEQYNLK